MRTKNEWLWFGLVMLTFLLTIWWIPGASTVNSDTYSVAFSGKSVFYEAARKLTPPVGRSVNELVPLDAEFDRIVILGPARQPTKDEWRKLFEAVNEGCTLVYAAPAQNPITETELFGARVVEKSEDGADKDIANFLGKHKPPDKSAATTQLVQGEIEWASRGRIAMDHKTYWEVLLEDSTGAQVVRRQFGSGKIVLIASDEVFSNSAMLEPQRAVLAYRILEAGQVDQRFERGVTYFDETLNASGTPQVVGVLFNPLFRPLTLQLLLLLCLFGWLGCRRFGPIRKSDHSKRRSIVEHAEAVGILYARARAGYHTVGYMHDYLRQELRRIYGSTFRVDDPSAVARQAQVDVNEVRRLFDQIRASGHDDLTTAGRIIRRLALLIAKIQRNAVTKDSG